MYPASPSAVASDCDKRQSYSSSAPSDADVFEDEPYWNGRVIEARTGRIRGDAAHLWLLTNDPMRGKKLEKPASVPASDDWLTSLRDVEETPLQPAHPAVYFVQEDIGGPVKIGFCAKADALKVRLETLQCGNHRLLVMRRALYGRRLAEARLHKRFAHLRLRGEWFRPEDELVELSRAVT